MRLIDADAMLNKLKQSAELFLCGRSFKDLTPQDKARVDEIYNCQAEILNATTSDAVPVVRCKDCAHYAPDIEYCELHSHFVTRNGDFCHPYESSEWKTFEPEDYCSQGERKTDADEPMGT